MKQRKNTLMIPRDLSRGTSFFIYYMSYLKMSAVVWLIAGLSACATTTPPASRNDTSVPHARLSGTSGHTATHIVARGETLWRIARVYQTNPEEIARINRISDSTVISIGQKLIIPSLSRKKTTTNFTTREDPETFVWPVKGRVAAYFRQKISGVGNKGIDIAAADIQNVIASRSGQIIFVGRLPGYGETIIIDHKDGLSTVYCGYASSCSIRRGEDVKQGTVLAKMGPSGARFNNALHFEIRNKHRPQNPLFYLSETVNG